MWDGSPPTASAARSHSTLFGIGPLLALVLIVVIQTALAISENPTEAFTAGLGS